ncbi:hypothetical protein CTEN210_18313 [Chaetoceros tenuissimus]|uniref:Helicase-associated domain-containing protein n=1 Tax=Chaetoceros tenuissimus TaxID=426638 RepID=A0AAD3DD85_9STRA|nr:hypothetical protein CTEN210_18313 [Chaetoceros tenuissimus]
MTNNQKSLEPLAKLASVATADRILQQFEYDTNYIQEFENTANKTARDNMRMHPPMPLLGNNYMFHLLDDRVSPTNYRDMLLQQYHSKHRDDIRVLLQQNNSCSSRVVPTCISSQKQNKAPGRWNSMYHMLVEFNKQNGHCNVSQNCETIRTRKEHLCSKELKDYRALARWVGNQRVFYKKYCKGEKTKLNQERVEALERIGFIWDLRDAKWLDKYHCLKKFQKESGHCRVSMKDDTELYKWMISQRYLWKRKKIGKPQPHLPQDREQLLLNIGFTFED